ncbi:hypothetical protein KAJ27_02570 [bacterium]|nr:hypothetical protein [bacterium]
MKIYLSSLTVAILLHLYRLFPYRKVNVLKSFGVVNSDDHLFLDGSIPNIGSLMYDCGTYSLHFAKSVSEAKVHIDDYIAHLIKGQHHTLYDHYSNFDKNFTAQGFQENLIALKKMEAAGLKPFPVVHDYWMREIPYYINEGYDFIALGNVMLKGSNTKLRRQRHIDHAMSIIPVDRKVHLFGASSYKAIAHLNLYSCDSSSWALNSKFGFILFWDPNKSGEDKTVRLFFLDRNRDYWGGKPIYWEKYKRRDQLETYIGTLGFTYSDLMGHNRGHYRKLLNAIYYLTIEDVITQKRQQQKFAVAV